MPTFDHACCTQPSTWPAPEEALLVLAMRRPRGTWLHHIYAAGGTWLKDAGPSDALLDTYRAGDLDWAGFAARYRTELLSERPGVLVLLRHLAATHPTGRLVVLCWERLDARHPHCHRTLLVELLQADAEATNLLAALPLPAPAFAGDTHSLRVAYNMAAHLVQQCTTRLDATRSLYAQLPAALPPLAPARLARRADLLTAQIRWQRALAAWQEMEAPFTAAVLTAPTATGDTP
jgi:uncharacterized protein YeaO (DUF488 family)